MWKFSSMIITTLDHLVDVQIYVRSLLKKQSEHINTQVIKLFEKSDQFQFKLLHLHDRNQLLALKGECPAVIQAEMTGNNR